MKRSEIKRRPLADTTFAGLEPEHATYREQDGNSLYFRVKPNGQKSWELRYKKPDGKWSWLGLGGYPEISGSLARQKAAQLREVEALERKKLHLNERFQTIQSEADQALEKAQQAERDAATSYAKSLASGDAEGEKSASGEMQKAAKQLAITDEQVRRQDLILGALQVELDKRNDCHLTVMPLRQMKPSAVEVI